MLLSALDRLTPHSTSNIFFAPILPGKTCIGYLNVEIFGVSNFIDALEQ
jgi:hypothetical protein